MSNLLFIQQYAPHGTIKGQEVLDACLMGSAFASCTLLFLDDGIYQIKTQQDTAGLGVKDYSVSYGVLSDYGVEKICCRKSDLDQRNLTPQDLIIEVEVLDDSEIASMIAENQQVLTF
jgi:tRNA 2-thiouridine synthesizing protein C